jgi:hypothetical protein
MGQFERRIRSLVDSIRSSWRRRPSRGTEADGRPRRDVGDLRNSNAARKAEAAFRDLRDSETARKAQEAVRDLRDSETARKAQEAVRDLRDSETGRKAEATIQEAEAAARAAYLRLRRSMGDR